MVFLKERASGVIRKVGESCSRLCFGTTYLQLLELYKQDNKEEAHPTTEDISRERCSSPHRKGHRVCVLHRQSGRSVDPVVEVALAQAGLTFLNHCKQILKIREFEYPHTTRPAHTGNLSFLSTSLRKSTHQIDYWHPLHRNY